MTITQDQIRLYASERLTDFDDGGGAMSPNVIVDGEDNNLFDDISEFDRLVSSFSIRKLFGQVSSPNNDTLLSAFVFLDSRPEDPAADALIFRAGGYTSVRAEADAAFAAANPAPSDIDGLGNRGTGGTSTAGSATVTGLTFTSTLDFDSRISSHWYRVSNIATSVLRRVVSRSGSDVTLDAPIPFSGAGTVSLIPTTFLTGLRQGAGAYGVVATIALAAEDAVALSVGQPWADRSGTRASASAAATFFPNDAVLIHHTTSMTPAAVSNGQTVNTTRTNLFRLEVIGNDGTVHARFDAGAPAPTGVGCTADLSAGTVTFSDVSGYSQPVTVRHRIEELNVLTAVVPGSFSLSRPLSREYPIGTKVSSLMRLGDLQGRVQGGFAQQAWTGVWSDAVIGGTPLADFNDTGHPIVTTNAGAIEERWAVIFTNTTTFRCFGESIGEITGGNVGADYAPTNPATGQPYFTIPALGWGLGWASGNVWRFNTKGANAPLWALRSIAPSAPVGSDKAVIEFRGYVNE